MAGDYKAGTAWLEIVPSFRGIEGALGQEVEKMARQVDSTLAASIPEGVRRSATAVAKEMRKVGEEGGDELAFGMARRMREAEKGLTKDLKDGVKKEMADAGEKGALEFAGAFKKAIRGRTGTAMGAIPKIEIGVDASAVDRELAKIRSNISSLDRAFINSRIPEAALFNGMEAQRRKLEDIRFKATKQEDFHNASYALDDLNQLESMFRNMRTAGLNAKGAFGGAFDSSSRESIRSMLRDLPDVNATSTKPQDRELGVVRRDLNKLMNTRIGIDMDLGPFLIEMAKAEAKLKALGDKHFELKYDTDKAVAKIGKLFDEVLPQKADNAGTKFADRFNEKFGDSIGKAFKALPDIEVRANTSDARLDLAAVKKQLQDLSKETIGVTLHQDIAIAQIEDMKRRLDEVSRSDPNVQVKADVAAAIAQLDEILVLAGRIEKTNPKVKVKVEGKKDADDAGNSLVKLAEAAGIGGSRLAALIALGIGLGSVLVPAAAAAAVAVSGIAAAAAGAVSGISVFALGISGVTAGVQALNKYEDDQAKSAANLANTQERVSGALDGVRSAERSLANARANVADGAQRAAKTVIDAERGVTDATKQRQRAVQDLQRAYEDARKQDEDRALSLRSTELAQRRAALDLADAKKNLEKVMANPLATAAEREAAKIAYEEQVLQLDELAVRQKRLQEEQTKASKVGVEGSDQVVAAREKVQQADDNIQKAQERLADSIAAQQRQQREGSYQIEQATQAVTNAQRQLEKATTSAGVAGGEALDNLKWAMLQLGPAGASFAKFIFGLKRDFLDLRQAAQSSMLPGLQIAIEGLLTYLPGIRGFVSEVGAALGGIFIDMVQQLKNPTWQRFFKFIADSAVPSLQGMYRFAVLTAQGFADLIMALSPFNASIGAGLINMAQGFSEWAATLQDTTGYQKFLDYVARVGPKVVDLFAEMGTFIIRLVQAAAPIGEVILTALVSMFEWLNSLPIERLTVIVTLLAGFYAILLTGAGVAKVFNVFGRAFEAFGKGQEKVWGGLKGLVSDYRSELDRLNGKSTSDLVKSTTDVARGGDFMSNRLAQLTDATRETDRAANNAGRGVGFLNTALAGGATAANNAKKGLGALTDFMGGKLGVVLAGATIIAGSYFEQQAKIEGQANDMKSALESIATAYQEGGNAAVSSLARTNSAVRDTLGMLQQYGVSAQMVFNAQGGSPTAQSGVLDSLKKEQDRLNKQLSDFKDSGNVAQNEASFWSWIFGGGSGKAKPPDDIVDRIQAIDKLVPKMKEQYAQQKALADAEAEAERNGTLFTSRLENIRSALDSTNPTTKQFETALQSLGAMSFDVTDKLDAYVTLSDKVATSNLAASDKAKLFHSILDQIGESATTSGPTFDALSGVFNGIADSALNASEKTSLLKQAMDQMYEASINQVEADERLARTQADLSTQLDLNSSGFELKKDMTDADRDATLRNRDALEAALVATREKYIADIVAAQESDDVAAATDKARRTHEENTTAILNQIDPVYRDSAAVQELVTKYGSIPGRVETEFKAGNVKSLYDQLSALQIAQYALMNGLSPEEAQKRWELSHSKADEAFRTASGRWAMADGGQVGGSSPNKRADNIPVWLTANEFVHPVDAVEYYGVDAMEAIRKRLIPRDMMDGWLSPSMHAHGYADGGMVRPVFRNGPTSVGPANNGPSVTIPINVLLDAIKIPTMAELRARWSGTGPVGAGPGFLPWPGSPAAQRGDSGVWRSIANLTNQSGIPHQFGNAYRPGDPLWHGSGRAIDYMGYNQDALAQFFMNRMSQVLELIHTTPKGGYYITRGRRVASMGEQNELHRNHLHIAMAQGGLVPRLFDAGGRLPAGLGAYLNATGKPENVLTDQQWGAVFELAKRPATGQGNTYEFQFRDTTLTESRLRAMQKADAVRARDGRAR